MATTQDVDPSFLAGFFLCTKTRMRFWGWGKRELDNVSRVKAENPWTGLADWLRAAHALLDDKTCGAGSQR
jgi:hypothetical protein